MVSVGGSLILEELNNACSGVPVFGTLSCDRSPEYSNSQTLYNGTATRDTMALLLMYGDVHPQFFVTAIASENIQKTPVIITESEGCVLKRVNGTLIRDHLINLGLVQNIGSASSIPFLVDYNDGTKLAARGIYNFTPEGYAVCGGEMPMNSALYIGRQDYNGIMQTAAETVHQALNVDGSNGILMYPCLSRGLMLGADGDAEMESVIKLIGDGIPYQICYSGGEICPLTDGDGQLLNRFHNFTYTACVF
jgi:hypothetical protein